MPYRGKMISKAKAQKAHARRRAVERFGVLLTSEAEREIVEKIRAGRATFIRRESNRISLFGVIFVGQETVVVYDRLRGTVVTLMHRDQFERRHNLQKGRK
jgi:hypothetical protein